MLAMPKKHFNTHPNRQCEHPFAVDTRASSAGTAFGKIRKSSRIRQALNPSPLAPFGLSIERFMCFIRTHVPSRAVIQLVRPYQDRDIGLVHEHLILYQLVQPTQGCDFGFRRDGRDNESSEMSTILFL
jgi:hypothetical protein